MGGRVGLLVVLALVGCGGRPAPLGGGGDGGRGDAAASAFCRGPARAEVNGAVMAAQASGEMMYLDCCEAAGVVFVPVGTGHRIFVSWRHSGGPSPTSPVTLDLASPPPEWGINVTVDCDAQIGCSGAGNVWSGTLEGTLTVTTLDQQYPAYDMTLCLAGAEDQTAPQAAVHSMRLWAPHVVAEVGVR